MNRTYRNMSPASVLVIVLLLCSIVCTATNVFGRVFPAETARIVKKESQSTQLNTQLAEKSESETKTENEARHDTPFFAIQTVIQLFRFDIATPAVSGFVYTTRFGSARSVIPLYLFKRTIRI
ncbi:MAG: hypothetical protein QM762_26600 [Chryseolinea sp.]